jgi:putative transposase
MIDRSHDLPVFKQAELLDISRSAVYYVPRPISEADLALMRRIDELHLPHPFMGARAQRRMLAKEGSSAGRRHIGTLMTRLDIEALAPKSGISKARPGHKIYPTCCAISRSLARTRSGHSTPRMSRWRMALCI